MPTLHSLPIENPQHTSATDKQPKVSATKSQSSKVQLVLVITLIAACLLTYWQVVFHEFQTFWDDQWVAINYYTSRGLKAQNLWNVLTEYYNGQYAPVNEYYYILLHAVFGYDPFWFHLGSLLIHIGNVLLAYFVIHKLLTLTQAFSLNAIRRVAFITALLLAVHPMTVEDVAWVSASKNIIYTFFYLAALLVYLKYIETKQVKFLWWTALLFLFSFGAKEQAVVLPVCLVLLDYVLRRNLYDKKVWLEKVPFFGLSIFFGIVTMFSQADNGEGILSGEASYPFYQNALFGSYSLIEYLTKLLLPVKLSYLYPFPNEMGKAVPVHFWLYPCIIIVLAVTLWSFWKKKWVFFGVAFFIIHVALVLHIIPLSRYAIIADRYVYLASIGVFFLLAYYFDKAYTQKLLHRKVLIGIAAIYVLSLGIYTRQRSMVWYSSDTLKKELRDLIKERNEFEHKPAYNDELEQ